MRYSNEQVVLSAPVVSIPLANDNDDDEVILIPSTSGPKMTENNDDDIILVKPTPAPLPDDNEVVFVKSTIPTTVKTEELLLQKFHIDKIYQLISMCVEKEKITNRASGNIKHTFNNYFKNTTVAGRITTGVVLANQQIGAHVCVWFSGKRPNKDGAPHLPMRCVLLELTSRGQAFVQGALTLENLAKQGDVVSMWFYNRVKAKTNFYYQNMSCKTNEYKILPANKRLMLCPIVVKTVMMGLEPTNGNLEDFFDLAIPHATLKCDGNGAGWSRV